MSRYVQLFTNGFSGGEMKTTFRGNIVEDDQGVLTMPSSQRMFMFGKTLDMVAGWGNGYVYCSPIKLGEPTEDLVYGQVIEDDQ
tara:strand:- start:3 stop:254 length:252 start_codon:yes stop_codon:yes gene_type:complete